VGREKRGGKRKKEKNRGERGKGKGKGGSHTKAVSVCLSVCVLTRVAQIITAARRDL